MMWLFFVEDDAHNYHYNWFYCQQEPLAALREALIEAKTANTERATRNAEMRDRLTAMKGQMQDSVGGVVNKMMGMLGKSVEDLMTEEQVVKILVETFKKFDADGSGQLEYPEVTHASIF